MGCVVIQVSSDDYIANPCGKLSYFIIETGWRGDINIRDY